MRAVTTGGLIAAAFAGFAVARWYHQASLRTDLPIAAALHPNRQADRDERIIAVANRAQVQL